MRGENYTGQIRRWSAPRQLVKIKPKIASSFARRKISSSQDPDHTDFDFNKNLDSCSLGRACSLASLGNHRKEKTRSSQGCGTELHGMTNFDDTSKIMEDIELRVIYGEAPFFNMPIRSSLEDKVEGDGSETDSLTFEANEGQMDNQLAFLEDISVLFSENQELAINTLQNVAGGKAVEDITEGELIEKLCMKSEDIN